MVKMKTLISLCFILIALFLISNIQGGKTDTVAVSIEESDKFTEEEINKAIKAVKRKFKEFNGSEMTKLWYSEEDSNEAIESYLHYGGGSEGTVREENIIVLLSNFHVDSTGAEEGFNPNTTYMDWNWILVRDGKADKWRVEDWGY